MKVLIACEESQEVCKAFRARGHEAYSCDIQEPSGGHPEWHILDDARAVMQDGLTRYVKKNTKARSMAKAYGVCFKIGETGETEPGKPHGHKAKRRFTYSRRLGETSTRNHKRRHCKWK